MHNSSAGLFRVQLIFIVVRCGQYKIFGKARGVPSYCTANIPALHVNFKTVIPCKVVLSLSMRYVSRSLWIPYNYEEYHDTVWCRQSVNIEVWPFFGISVFIIDMHNCRSNYGFAFVAIRSLDLQARICHYNCWLHKFNTYEKFLRISDHNLCI